MKPYLDFLQRILDKDRQSSDRTGVGTIKVAGEMMKFPLMRGNTKIVPVTTTKKLYFNGVKTELLWFRDGQTNAMSLIAAGNHIWDAWMMPEAVQEERVLNQGERLKLLAAKLGIEFDAAVQLINDEHDAIMRGPDIHPPESIPDRADLLDNYGIPRTAFADIHAKGDLGPIYGETWRRAPAGGYFINMSDTEVQEYIDMMAPDQKAQLDSILAAYTFLDDENRQRVTRKALTKIGIDQLSQALHKLRTNPDDRRIIVNAWIPQYVPIDKGADMKGLSSAEVSQLNARRDRAALAYCHVLFQFLTEELTEEERLALVEAMPENNKYSVISIPLPAVVTLSRRYASALHAGKIKPGLIPLDHEGRPNSTVDTRSMLDALEIPRYKLNCVMYQRSHQSALAA